MPDGVRLKDHISSGQFEPRANIDLSRPRNTGSRSPFANRGGLAKVNIPTRIPIKIDTPSSVPPVPSVSSPPLSVPLSSSASSSSVSSPLTSELSPEIYFLIRQHAKTLTAINKITNRLEKLEHKVEDICKKVKKIDKFNESRGMGGGGGGIKKGESSSSSGNNNTTTTPNALSDDSGVEYSRTTTGTGHDDDELLCLLNQITKFSDSIKQTLTQPNSNIHSPLNPRTGHPMIPGENGSMVYGLTGNTSSTASSTLRQSVTSTSNTKGIRYPHPPSTRKTLPSSPVNQSRMADCPDPASAPQSFSALLFESNVDHFLANLDFMPEPVRASEYYYPPSMPISSPPHHHLNHHLQHVKSHPVPASHLLTETLHHQHEQPEQQ